MRHQIQNREKEYSWCVVRSAAGRAKVVVVVVALFFSKARDSGGSDRDAGKRMYANEFDEFGRTTYVPPNA